MDSILIVDDEKDNLEALQRLLRGMYEVTVVTSPFEALKLVKAKEFNVIVSDQRMPEISGVEFLEKVKQVTPASTRILLTGYTDIESVIGAINRGQIYRYIAKPWDPEDLKLTLKQANEAFLLRRELEVKNKTLEKTNQELNKALGELILLDQAKASFMSLISHELNTPLTILSSFSTLLSELRSGLAPEVAKAADGIGQAAERFSQIVDEVLTYVKISSETKFHPVEFDLGQEARAVLNELAAETSNKKVTWEWKSVASAVGRCDAEKMRLALKKLFGEVLHQCSPSETVELTLHKKGKSVEFTLTRKKGAFANDAFELFVPSGNKLHHQRNLGLSLALCKLIVESQGGKIGIAADKNKSTLFLECPA